MRVFEFAVLDEPGVTVDIGQDAGRIRITARSPSGQHVTLDVPADAEWRFDPPADPQGYPQSEPLVPGARLAQSILSHRPWCPDCQPHAEQAHRALVGQPIEVTAPEAR